MPRYFPYRFRVLILLFTLIMITYLDRITISLVGVRIKSEFHLSNEQFGWILGAFALAYALFEIPSGVLGDRLGQKTVLIRIVLWWSFFTALSGATTGFISLILCRFLFGVGEAGAFPNSTASISRWFPAKETSRAISSILIGLNLGAAIAPLLVVPIAAAFGWRAPFFVNGLIGVVWVAICWRWFHNEPSAMKGILQKEVQLIEQHRRYTSHPGGFPWRKTIGSRNLLAMLFAFFASQWALYFFVAWMPVYLQQGKHFSEFEMSRTTSFLFIAGIAGSLCSGFLGDWLTRKKNLKFSRRLIGIMALSLAGIAFFLVARTENKHFVSVGLILGDLFFSFFGIVGFSTCVDIGRHRAGTVAGIMNFAAQIGAFFLAIFFGKMVDLTDDFNFPMNVIAGILLLGGLLWGTVDPNRQITPKAAI